MKIQIVATILVCTTARLLALEDTPDNRAELADRFDPPDVMACAPPYFGR
jgi:hypothetical protein